MYTFIFISDIVTGLPPNSKAMKQKTNFTDLGSGSNVSTISQDVSLLSKSEVNTNENITEGKKHHALTNAQNIIMGEEKQAPSIDSHDILTRESKGTLPHTTVFPVTRSNLGKILQALVNSKRAKAQGIAFVKSRQDLKDALRILFISRGLGLNRMNRTLLRSLTGPQMIKTSSETTERLTNVLPTSKPAITTLTRDSYGGNEELPNAKDLQIQYRNLNTESQIGYLPQQVKATVPTIFKQAQLHPSTKLNQFQSNSEAFKEKTKTAPSHGKTVVKPTISSGISSFEEEILIGANHNPKIVEYNVKGQNTTKSFDIREKSIREKSHSKMTESSTVSNAITMKTEADAISINRLEAVLSDIHGIETTRPTADAISVKRPEPVPSDISGQTTTRPSEIQTLPQSKVTESNTVSNSTKMKSDADYNSIKRLLTVVSDIHGIKTTTPTADAISIKRPEPVSSGMYEQTSTRPVKIKSISQLKMTESNTISNSINKNSGSYYNTIKRLVTVLSDINGLKTSPAKIKTSHSAMQELSILSKLSQLKQEANSFLDKHPVPMSSDITGQTATKPVGVRTQMTESSTVPKLIKLKPEEITITDKRPIPVSTAVSVQEALAEILRARLALLGRGILSSNVTFATPLTTYISTQNKNAEQSVLVTQQRDITPSVKQMSTRNKEPSVINENVSIHTEYNIPGETKHLKSKASSLAGTSDLKPFHWLNKPTMDFTTMKQRVSSDQTTVEHVVSRAKPSTEKTKTFFSTSGMTHQLQQPVSNKEARIIQQLDRHLGHTTVSPISMYSDARKQSFNMFKDYDFEKYKNTHEKGKTFLDSNIAVDKGVSGAKPFHRIRQTTKGPYHAKKTQLEQENNYSSGSGKKGRMDSIMDRQMIQTPVKQYSQVPLSPLTMFSNNRRMSFMTLKTPRKSYISSPNPRVPDFSTTTTSTTVLPKFHKSQSRDLGVRPDVHGIHPRIPDNQLRDINVQQQVPGTKLNPPAVQPSVFETQPHVSDVEPNVYTVESQASQVNLRPPTVKSQAPVAKPRLPKFEPKVPDVQHVIKVQSSVPDFHLRIHDVNPSAFDIQKQVTDAQPRVGDVSSSVSGVQLGESDVKLTVSDIQYDLPRLLDVQSRTPGIQTHSSDLQRRISNIHSPISDINVNTLNVPIHVTDVQSHVPYVQSDVKPRLTEVKPSDFDINSRALGAKPRVPKVQSRYSDVKPRAPDTKSIYPDEQPRAPVDQSTSLNDQPHVPDFQTGIPVTQSRVYDTEPLVADAHRRVPDVQTSFTYVQPRPSHVKARITDANSRISDVQPFVTNVQPVPVVQPHATNAGKQTPIRNTINGLHSGNKLISKSSTTSDIPQVSHLRSIGVHVKNSYEVGSSKEKGSVIVSMGKTNDGKVKDSSRVHIDTKDSYRTKNAPTKTSVSSIRKSRIPAKDKAPHFRATTQNILKVPPNFKISDDGYHYEPSSQEVTQQKQKFSAKFTRYGQRHTGKLIIEHPQHNHTMDKAAALSKIFFII